MVLDELKVSPLVGGNQSREPSPSHQEQIVRYYLTEIRTACRKLAQPGLDASEDPMGVEDEAITVEDTNEAVDCIAHDLLSACHLSVLSSSVCNLPEHSYAHSEIDVPPPETEKTDILPYRRRRIDYLRLLLRAMAPISMDVTARICENLLLLQDQQIPPTSTQAAFVLFSVWLQIAPHIATLVSDLFSVNERFLCPFDTCLFKSLAMDEAWLMAEAAHGICHFFCRSRREHSTLLKWWNWDSLFQSEWMAPASPLDMADQARCWHVVRAAGYVLNLAPIPKAQFLASHGVQEPLVQWVIHPWEIEHEEYMVERMYFRGETRIWTKDKFPMPTGGALRPYLTLHPYLVELGRGYTFMKHKVVQAASHDSFSISQPFEPRLIQTPTTIENMSRLGAALFREKCPPSILVCGPIGSGKSSLVREVCRMFAPTSEAAANHDSRLLEIHVDEETDAKTLLGSYMATDVPGEFKWQPGALTRAVRQGKWVLMEDLDTVPTEIQAALAQLLKERLLPLGKGTLERCHPDFRIFGTLTTLGDARGKQSRHRESRVLNPSYWHRIDVAPLPFTELKQVADGKYLSLPESVLDSVFSIFASVDQSFGTRSKDTVGEKELSASVRMWSGRNPSVRDLFKLLSRIETAVTFENNVNYATEAQRTLCLAETVDVFVACCPDAMKRQEFIYNIAAPVWGITADLAYRYVFTRSPVIQFHEGWSEIGRSRIEVTDEYAVRRTRSESFAQTSHTSRLVESLAVAAQQNEPTLLVGETGTGKTSILQYLSKLCGRELVVQNLSLQTDSTDLLGGYRPLELHQIARETFESFVDVFTSTFSRKQNAAFLSYASDALRQKDWKKLSTCFQRAGKMGLDAVQKRSRTSRVSSLQEWQSFCDRAERFETQRKACDSGMAFVFTEGSLVEAITKGRWVLLDEINLASSETLQRLCGLLDNPKSSLTLTERGDSDSLFRHPDFRLFAAMNPATDAGKKDLNPSIRSRFTEMYVDELEDPVELRTIAGQYLAPILPTGDRPPAHTATVIAAIDVYLECRRLSQTSLADASGQRPRYTLRTLTRALSAARQIATQQKLSLQRALYEGFSLSFEGPLDERSLVKVKKTLGRLKKELSKKELDHPGRRPNGHEFVLLDPFWIKSGTRIPHDWSTEESTSGKSRFVLTPSTKTNLRRLSRAVAAGSWPVLLEGPTSSGKTTLVEYMAARCGHQIIRINNHEHTDIQEYTGSFVSDSNGSLKFQDGLLVSALRSGSWVILDELNLAPTEVLEALNRLLDDNRELYLPEVKEVVQAHPDFRLFATQNPSGAYGGRKQLSRAFRNRFVELYVGDIPSVEMTTILERRCGCPPSHSKLLVETMNKLRFKRSRSGMFLGKDGFMTPRDMLRWAERGSSSKSELAHEGYMLIAERLRTPQEKEYVKMEIERLFGVKIDTERLYYGDTSEARLLLRRVRENEEDTHEGTMAATIAPTRAVLRLLTLILRCVRQREPVLLVGETGCGKTTIIQILSLALKSSLRIINCHATTETSDFIGGLRPVRGRTHLGGQLVVALAEFLMSCNSNKRKDLLSLGAPDVIQALCKDKTTRDPTVRNLSSAQLKETIDFSKRLISTERAPSTKPDVHDSKRRKLDLPDFSILPRIERILTKLSSLFEWVDGPLVAAMKEGDMVLLDEISLADDAVLERLNSVLEPSRTLVLAEKGGEEDDLVISSHETFQLFATMNPGGDFGKRELSPALRSRFTEIWVPAISDITDIGMILSHSLQILPPRHADITRTAMLKYVQWFNDEVCGDPPSPLCGLSLSLRDIQTWSQFVVRMSDQKSDSRLKDMVLQGARLMHLDGLGLGSGVSGSDTTSAKIRAESFLSDALVFEHEERLPVFETRGSNFGCDPFWTPLGAEKVSSGSNFSFQAKTTATSVHKILRAMQLRKPVLIEGSPGVGKSAMVKALADATGHHLVRINLSEQTDMADLMGADLPVADNEASSIQQEVETIFKWCDGALLKAIKRGDWVLLDELNLAPQSVLEGLNSCLDHRSTVFVPELGQSFDCPPTFRIFAAQNPLAQGGGRKGLPKSFLNRFTRVFVDPLSLDDVVAIAAREFPGVEPLENIAKFNQRLEMEVVNQVMGSQGAPWEFNLRDIFRACAVVQRKGTSVLPDTVRDLYVHRFRTERDQKKAISVFYDIFGVPIPKRGLETIVVDSEAVRLSDVCLPRDQAIGIESLESNLFEGLASSKISNSFVALSRAVEMGWHCLLVGGPASFKSSMIRTLADATGREVVEIAMSPSSEVSDLVGSFEQMNQVADVRDIFKEVNRCVVNAIVRARHGSLVKDLKCILSLSEGLADSRKIELSLVAKLIEKVGSLPTDESSYKVTIEAMLDRIMSVLSLPAKSGRQVHFAWKDGVLIDAMIQGYWLHLKNANLCPSSVLDRLNPVMESGGSLLVTEGNTDQDAIGSHRRIEAHPNFRIFLSVDPEGGEVSRAMRNRCLELSVQNEPEDEVDCIRRVGLRLESTRNRLLKYCDLHVNKNERFSTLKTTSEILRSFILRNSVVPERHFACGDGNSDLLPGNTSGSEQPILPSTSRVDECLLSPKLLSLSSAALLRLFVDSDPIDASPRLLLSKTWQPFLPSNLAQERIILMLTEVVCNSFLRSTLLFDFLFDKPDIIHQAYRQCFLLRLNGSFRNTVSVLNSITNGFPEGRTPTNVPMWLVFVHVNHVLLQQAWEGFQKNRMAPCSSGESVLAKAYDISNQEVFGNPSGTCPLLPLFLPLFQAFDGWLHEMSRNSEVFEQQSYWRLLLSRHHLWFTLSRIVCDEQNRRGSICFDPSELIVSWTWLRKSEKEFHGRLQMHHNLLRTESYSSFESICCSIESVLFGSLSSTVGHTNALPVYSQAILFPKRQEMWEHLRDAHNLSASLGISRHGRRDDSGEMMSAIRLIRTRPRLLLFNDKIRKDVSNALSTLLTVAAEVIPSSGDQGGFDPRGIVRRIQQQVVQHEEELSDQLSSIHIDTNETEAFTGGEHRVLPSLVSEAPTYSDNLLEKYSFLQISAYAEMWCEMEERVVIRLLSKILLTAGDEQEIHDGILRLVGRIQDLVAVATTSSLWDMRDLQPYQILLWLGECEKGDVKTEFFASALRMILNESICNSHSRSFGGASDLLKLVSPVLEAPSFLFNPEENDLPRLISLAIRNENNDILCSLVFSFVGDLSRSSCECQMPFTTLQNFHVRKKQIARLSEITCRVAGQAVESDIPYELSFLLDETVRMIRKSFPVEVFEQLFRGFRPSLQQNVTSITSLSELAKCSECTFFREHADDLLYPLMQNLSVVQSQQVSFSKPSKELATAQVLLGLLRYHLLLPVSHLDPARKAAAKAKLLDVQRSHLSVYIAAKRMKHYGLRADPPPLPGINEKSFVEFQRLQDKVDKQKRKVIQRPRDTLPFGDFFYETWEFAKNCLKVPAILDLVERLSDTGMKMDRSTAPLEATELSKTISSFARTLASKFTGYDDVVCPISGSLALVNEGLTSLLLSRGFDITGDMGLQSRTLFNSMMAFPCVSVDMAGLLHFVSSQLSSKEDIKCKRNLCLAALSFLHVEATCCGTSHGVLSYWLECLDVLGSRYPSHNEIDFDRLTYTDGLTEDDLERYFPDFRGELSQASSEPSKLDIEEEYDQPDSPDTTGIFPPTDFTMLLADLHLLLFNSSSKGISDQSRMKLFEACFKAGFSLYTREHDSSIWNNSEDKATLSSLTTALCYSAGQGGVNFENAANFHLDPNPEEALKASESLKLLRGRLVQLLSTFPGNSILLAIARVAERAEKLDVNHVSLGKVMASMELVLKHAQDWEQHASQRVCIGHALNRIKQNVSSWRKLELASWYSLLDSHESYRRQRAKQLWWRMHTSVRDILRGFDDQRTDSEVEIADFPSWVFQSVSGFPKPPSIIHDVFKLFDTFCLTAPLGEFETRLNLIEGFAAQIEHEARFESTDMAAMVFARLLRSLHMYYHQFSATVRLRVAEIRKPLEEKLRREVKLAKWDEQTYYALADSTERNHRTLMKILREFDEQLCVGVSNLIEAELCRGVRGVDDVGNGDAPPTIPQRTAFFPLHQEAPSQWLPTSQVHESRDWLDTVDTDPCVKSASISKISHYYRKMVSYDSELGTSESACGVGAIETEALCQSIFDRIDSLRSEKSTRPMKERALVDLFRELKNQGFTSSLLSIPPEIRNVVHLFQIPQLGTRTISEDGMKTCIGNAERYYQRSLSEQMRLRGEISTIGSKHLTSSQLLLIQRYMDKGLLLISQQRCAIAKCLFDHESLRDILASAPGSDTVLHVPQGALLKQVREFYKSLNLSIEGLRQLRLSVALSKGVFEGKKADWARDVDAALCSVFSSEIFELPSENMLVVDEVFPKIEVLVQKLESATDIVSRYKTVGLSLAALPPSGFDICLQKMAIASHRGLRIIEARNHNIEDGDPLVAEEAGLKSQLLSSFREHVEEAIKATLLAFQSLCKNPEQTKELSIWERHQATVDSWFDADIGRINKTYLGVLTKLRSLHENALLTLEERKHCIHLVSDLAFLIKTSMNRISKRLEEFCTFHKSCTKLQYILLRVFRVLIARGFCSSEEREDDREGGAGSGMTFTDDQAGTGMGEGDGKKDVTDEIENEDQLLGLKGDDDDVKKNESPDQKQLDDEEVDKGMEMEADFDGEMYDVPDQDEHQDDGEKDDEEEELEREMGEESSPNDQVVDEKMWGDSDDEGDGKDEKFEEDNGVSGDAAAGEMVTKEDEEDNQGKMNEDSEKANPQRQPEEEHPEGDEGTKNLEELINEDTEERYEEAHGIDVRQERENEEEEGDMEIDDDLQLDGDPDGEDDSHAAELEDEKTADDDEKPNDSDMEADCAPDSQGEEGDDENDDSCEDNEVNTQAQMDDTEGDTPEEIPPDEGDKPPMEATNPDKETQKGLGVRSADGNDIVEETGEDEDAVGEDGKSQEEGNDGQDMDDESPSASSGARGSQSGTQGVGTSTGQSDKPDDRERIPNPFKSPGDVARYWHRKLNMIDSDEPEKESEVKEEPVTEDSREAAGDYEYAGQNQDSTAQALGETEAEDTLALEEEKIKEEPVEQSQDNAADATTKEDKKRTKEKEKTRDTRTSSSTKTVEAAQEEHEAMQVDDEEEEDTEQLASSQAQDSDTESKPENDQAFNPTNEVVADLAQMEVSDDVTISKTRVVEVSDAPTLLTDLAEARSRWQDIQSETHNLSRRLCEKLRLVMEPLVASKLRGDYRTGKRINMKRVIGYIASGYRKDKIWLRRTKPAKRNYRVLVAVDDSESMIKGGAGAMALNAMAVLATGMSQLEIGQLGIASFGDEMQVVHPFHQPFTTESGVKVVQHFQFQQQRTRTALCVQSAMMALDVPGDRASMQLVFLISDGRIERDSREDLRRLVRDMMERNILLALIIVEGADKKDSILNMKEVSFEKGVPKVKRFIEDYPFPYYILLEDMQSLPEVLGDALRQWFELLAQVQTPGAV